MQAPAEFACSTTDLVFDWGPGINYLNEGGGLLGGERRHLFFALVIWPRTYVYNEPALVPVALMPWPRRPRDRGIFFRRRAGFLKGFTSRWGRFHFLSRHDGRLGGFLTGRFCLGITARPWLHHRRSLSP